LHPNNFKCILHDFMIEMHDFLLVEYDFPDILERNLKYSSPQQQKEMR